MRIINSPELIFVCGSNGAGKSTLTYSLLEKEKGLCFIDPDRIAKENNMSLIQTGKYVSVLVKRLLSENKSFIKESTITSKFDFKIIDIAKKKNYKTALIYIGLESSDLAVLRVKNRHKLGGHDVPERDIKRRYFKSINNLPKALMLFDHSIIYENTGNYDEVLEIKNSCIIRYSHTPKWFKECHTILNLPDPGAFSG